MHISIAPFVPNTKIVNKTIVYSDTILPLKSKSSNLKVTSIKDVSEPFLEDCLRMIFKSNPNVVFNTIQYSKAKKIVYFYTNKEITTKEFEESKYAKYKPISSLSQILEEIKSILTTNKIKNSDCISLYDVIVLMTKINYEYEKVKKTYIRRIDNLIEEKFDSSSYVVIYDFDYDNQELSIGFNYNGYNYRKIFFAKSDGNLYITKSEFFRDKDVLVAIGTELSQLYDEFMKFSAYKRESKFNIRPINSNLFVDISSHSIDIFTEYPIERITKDFKLTFIINSGKYKYDCNSTTIITAIEGKEKEIFKKIFVKIEDCPKWCQEILSEIRRNQLIEEQKIEYEEKNKQLRKQKRLELTKKIFPFLEKENKFKYLI